MSEPLLSIITVTYNAEATLERTILSVVRQSCRNIEHIIVDGRSTDGTVDIIKKYETHISKWISEPDGGIYDAMNKGLDMARGQYVWFLNAGDEIAAPDTVERLFGPSADADVYYGNTVMTDMDGNVVGDRRLSPPDTLTWKSFKRGMLVSHQAFIAKRSLCGHYDTRYRFSADFGWCVEVMKRARKNVNSGLTLARFLDGGITKHNIVAGLKERFRIMCHYYGIFSTILNHVPITLKFVGYVLVNRRF